MKKGTLIICDREEAYAKRLMEYLSSRERLFDISVFTAVSALLEHLSEHKTDILLIEEELMNDAIAQKTDGQIILLSEANQVQEASEGYFCVYKLQPAENIHRELIACYAKQSSGYRPFLKLLAEKHLELFGVFSPEGGCGKTTFSLLLGQQLAKHKRTLYLSLESFSSLLCKKSGQRGMSDLLYHVKERSDRLAVLLPALVEKQEELDCVLAVDYYGDLVTTQEEDMEYLLNELEKSDYDAVIFDVGYLSPAVFYLLAQCQRIFCPRQRREENQAKMVAFERTLRAEEREELLERMENVLLPDAGSKEMEHLLWKLAGE